MGVACCILSPNYISSVRDGSVLATPFLKLPGGPLGDWETDPPPKHGYFVVNLGEIRLEHLPSNIYFWLFKKVSW